MLHDGMPLFLNICLKLIFSNCSVNITDNKSLYINKCICRNFYFSFQPVLHDWCNKRHGMCYPVYGMVHIKEPLLLIGKSNPCGGSGFPLTFYLRLYGIRHMVNDNSDNERGNPLPPHGPLFPISSKGSFICIIPQTG